MANMTLGAQSLVALARLGKGIGAGNGSLIPATAIGKAIDAAGLLDGVQPR
jgi:hypothetical protein